jgi:hypothetical protein
MARPDKLAEVHQQLAGAVDELVSGADWRRFLDLSHRLHTYSTNNLLLILAQRPTATRVAGYRTWQSRGYQVRRGEKGIAVLAPVISRSAPDDDDEPQTPGTVRVLRGFRVVHVFDISQCDGPPWPDVAPVLLRGQAPDGLWDGLAAQVEGAGFTLGRGPCGDANGRTNFIARTVRVRDDVEPAQAVRTLAHELAHVLLHDDTTLVAACRDRVEVEAESVAFLVTTTAGIDAGGYSFAYVAAWSTGRPELVAETADRVVTTARRIIAGLQPNTARPEPVPVAST